MKILLLGLLASIGFAAKSQDYFTAQWILGSYQVLTEMRSYMPFKFEETIHIMLANGGDKDLKQAIRNLPHTHSFGLRFCVGILSGSIQPEAAPDLSFEPLQLAAMRKVPQDVTGPWANPIRYYVAMRKSSQFAQVFAYNLYVDIAENPEVLKRQLARSRSGDFEPRHASPFADDFVLGRLRAMRKLSTFKLTEKSHTDVALGLSPDEKIYSRIARAQLNPDQMKRLLRFDSPPNLFHRFAQHLGIPNDETLVVEKADQLQPICDRINWEATKSFLTTSRE